MEMSADTFIYLEFLRQKLMPLPGVEEKLCFGTPAFYVNKKYFARLWDDGETLVLQTLERDRWITTKPDAFFVTDHYFNYDYMLVRLKTVLPADLELLLLTAWRNRATKKLIREYETNNN
ncbi:hypothetical protein KXD93_28190 [Mucilaginibacter sp. BJC16-A38]|uniref:hypothetical protein n=1 Tax=Mucilaginibacter phenanthrenivorans TaxID=1234842 RepID=UPI002157E1D2|nr:hypothetical protein [Mucilaginibacter phenanthrenivorans]MCR8561568.1 hypothetical protein [Mucilaginibacter phenanthrenivorans]